MNIGGIVKSLRETRGITQKELAKVIGVSDKAVSTWELGIKEPRMGAVERIAEYFSVSKSYLLDNGADEKKNKFMIPVLGKVQAGIPVEAIECIIDYEEITEDMARQGEFFALQIRGGSMEPKFSDGDVVIVRKQSDVDSGSVSIVLVNGNDATVKKVTKFDGGISLVPTNPAFEVQTYTNEQIEKLPITILGKVVELRAKF